MFKAASPYRIPAGAFDRFEVARCQLGGYMITLTIGNETQIAAFADREMAMKYLAAMLLNPEDAPEVVASQEPSPAPKAEKTGKPRMRRADAGKPRGPRKSKAATAANGHAEDVNQESVPSQTPQAALAA